jgi:hypothetical protein
VGDDDARPDPVPGGVARPDTGRGAAPLADDAARSEVARGVTVGELVRAVESTVGDAREAAQRLIDRGRYRKLRISRKGKPIAPDIPLAAVAALEAASLAGGGIARALAVNLGAKMFLDFEVVSEADAYVERAKRALLDGDLAGAAEALQTAVKMDDGHAEAFLELAVLARLDGRVDDVRRHLARVLELDPNGPLGARARAILERLEAPR